MRQIAILVTVLAVLAFPIIGSAQSSATCPPDYNGYANPRLTQGGEGVVMPGTPNRVRNGPSTTAEIVGSIEAGDSFRVVGGPICAAGIVWWLVESADVDGWTAESANGNYFLEPVGVPALSVPEIPPVPPDAPRQPDVVLNSSATHIAFTGAETLLIAATGEIGAVDMWEVENARPYSISMAPQDTPIIYYAENLQPDGQGGDTILTGDTQGRVFLWDPFFFTYIEEPIDAALIDAYAPSYATSPPSDFTRVAIGGCFEVARDAGCSLGGAEVWDISGRYEGEVIPAFEVSGHAGAVNALDISDDNTLLVTAGDDGTVLLWDMADNGEFLGEINVTDTEITALDIAPDGGSFTVGYCGALQGNICLVAETAVYSVGGTLIWRAPAHGAGTTTLDYDTDGEVIASGGLDGIVRLWDAASGELVGTFAPGGNAGIADVRFFDLYDEIAVASQNSIGVFSLE